MVGEHRETLRSYSLARKRFDMNHDDNGNRHEVSVMTDEQLELEHCKQQIARLKQLVIRLSEIALRNVVRAAEDRKSERA
ncbi:hypothetical protein BJA5080_02658 [Bradyrhizobium diazoefficiens SEMIA 5080]|uniref:Uncharacterized protein n=2 Tax=Nitrobacteraceae TaxID=41294 RepID=A0A837CAP3_9BRAD|nr:hypothetical protein BJA5080_02658 [Bradyrhizobium diazoefficiens SEMIA 5080]